MKHLVVIILAVALMAGVVYAQDNVITKKAGDYTVTANFDKTPPTVGENNLLITIKDQAGKAITDAAVKVNYYMSEKASGTRKSIEMPYMGTTTAATVKAQGYNAKLNFTMPGRWVISVKITRSGKDQTVDLFINL